MSVNRNDGMAAAKALASVAASYVEAGTAPATVAVAMAGESAAMLARITSPAGAARMLRNVADKIEAAATGSRPVTAPEAMAIGRAAVDAMVSEFTDIVKEAVALIDTGRAADAREMLANAARKIAKPQSTSH